MLQNLLKTSLFILSLVLATSLLGSSSVNAQSAFDDVYTIDTDLYVGIKDEEDQYFQFTEGIDEFIGFIAVYGLNSPTFSDKQLWTDFIDNPDNYAYSLSSILVHSTGRKEIELSIFEKNTNLTFGNLSSSRQAILSPNYEGHLATVGFHWGTNIQDVSLQNHSTFFAHAISIRDTGGFTTKYNNFAKNFTITYPENYEGLLINDIPPTSTTKIGVSIRGSVAEDIVQVEYYHDENNPKPENAQGMYLVLHNINFDDIPPECSNQDIQEWRHSLEEIAIFNPVPCYGMWYVQSYYTSDPQGQNVIPNTDKTSLNLRIDGGSFYFDYADVEYDEDGTIISPPITGVNMADCVVFTESLPYVEFNYQGCFGNIQKFIGIAQTNQTHVSRQFNAITLPAHQSCGSFTKFNNFLHISDENNWLCPQMTEGLRQPITLFAVFLLYVLTMFGLIKLMSGKV